MGGGTVPDPAIPQPTGLLLLVVAIRDVFTQVVSWAKTVGTTVTETPVLLLFCVAVPLCGIGVGMFKRLLHARG